MIIPIHLLIPALLLALLLHHFLDRQRSRCLPPGPLGLPVVGSLLHLGEAPHQSLKKFADKYGDIMCIRLGWYPTIIVSSCEKAKIFLKTHDASFAGRFSTAAGEAIFGNSDFLTASYGKQWKHLRRICVTHLLNQRMVESARQIMEAEACAAVESLWEQSCHGRRAVDVSKACMEMVFYINMRFFTGERDLIMWDDKPLDFKAMLDEGSRLLGAFNTGDFLPFLRWFDLQGIRRRARDLRCRLDDAFCKMMEDYWLKKPQGGKKQQQGEEDKRSFLDVLMNLVNVEGIIDSESSEGIMRNMIGAGTETTATALEWAMSELVKNPHIMNKLRQDLQRVVAGQGQGKNRPDGSSVENMKYLHCVIKETLRLHPPGTMALPHQCLKSVTVDGFHIPEGTRLLFNLWAMGRDAKVWDEADQFRPERFMAEQVVEVCGNSDFRMLPFGAGRRGCPGTVLVAPILKICLATLVFAFDWAPEHGDLQNLDMSEAYGVSTVRKNKLMLVPRLINPSLLIT